MILSKHKLGEIGRRGCFRCYGEWIRILGKGRERGKEGGGIDGNTFLLVKKVLYRCR